MLNGAALTNDDDVTGPAPVPPPRWHKWLSVGASLLMIGFLIQQSAAIGWGEVIAVLPTNPLFYVIFAAMYLTLPFSELVIFRRQWAIGLSAIWLFLRKRVLNEVVFGYSGEAYLYLWAKRQPGLRAGALGVVKDINITSALAATLLTLVTLAGLLVFQNQLVSDGLFTAADLGRLGWGAVLFCAPALLILLFSQKLMTLPRAENITIFWMHMARLLVGSALMLAAWHIALPDVAWRVWIVLAALRLVLGRLPFAPNTDLLFSSIGVGLTGGSHSDIAALLVLCAALGLVGHGLVLAADAAVRWRGRKQVELV